MAKLIGIVEKPQFDMNTFNLGQAIHVVERADNDFKLLDTDALIAEYNPLCLDVTYYSKNEHEFTNLSIHIQDLVHGNYEITLLKEEK